jgi:peptidoglycan-associated lipoprotein
MTSRPAARAALYAATFLAALAVGGCAANKAPVERPTPPPPAAGNSATPARPPAPPEPAAEPVLVPPEPVTENRISTKTLEDLNRNSPLEPVFFEYDSSQIDTAGQHVLESNAAILKQNPRWTVTIEGHCDERGSAEYNLALGERRAVAARSYLVSLGISADRLRTVSYGKEFPFDPGHTEAAWAKNRRAHFVITAQ